MQSLIDKLLSDVKATIADIKKPLQKRLISRGLEKSLDAVESATGDAELALIKWYEELVTASSEDQVKYIFSKIVELRSTLANASETKKLLEEEQVLLFGKEK